jgi:hypothetical protein
MGSFYAGRASRVLTLCLAAPWSAFTGGYPPGLRTMEHPEMLPFLLPDGVQTRQFVSYDPSGANNDGNFRTAYTKYIDSNGEYVIFDASGPGCLYRQQYNVWFRGRYRQAGQAHIKYYFDNETAPRVDLPVDELFGGKHTPFTAPFAFLDPAWRFGILYYPFPFKTRLKIATTLDLDQLVNPYNTAWYQYTYLTYPDPTPVTTWAGPQDDSSRVRAQWDSVGVDPKPALGNAGLSKTVAIPSGTARTLVDLKGEGSLTSLKLNIEPYSREVFYHTTLRIYWDDAVLPAVDMPIGHFFGGGGENYAGCKRIPEMSLRTLFYGFDGPAHEFYSFWPMPYWRTARIELRNDSGVDLASVRCDVQYKPAAALRYPKGEAGHFYAKRTTARDAGRGLFATAFEETGHGHVVGLSFYSAQYAMDGDEFTYIDGSRTPQIHGDGTEDDHNQGWGGSAYQKPLWGGLVNGYQGSYRIYMNDPYVFNRHIKINYEFSREGGADYGGETDATVYYYKSPSGGNLVLTDEVDVGDATSEAAHRYSVSGQTWTGIRSSGYDGYERNYEYDMLRDDGRAFTGHSEFAVAIAGGNHGVKLRRRIYHSGNGIQRADVYVDGVKVKERPWDICTLSSAPFYQGWFDSDYEIPSTYTKGKRSIRIRVQHAGGGTRPEINEFFYWVYSYLDGPVKAGPVKLEDLTATPTEGFPIELSWRRSRTSPFAQYYRIYRSRQQDFSDPALAGTSNAPRFVDVRLRPGATYYYRIAAVDLSGVEAPSSAQAAATARRGGKPASADFLGTDETTMGNWGDKYGSEGFILLRYFFGRDAQAWPDYVSDIDYGAFKSRQFSDWRTSTKSSLVTSPISSQRFLGALETSIGGSVRVYVNDARLHELALYVCDFDKAGREEEIEILDLDDHVIAPARKVTAFETGKWLRYRFTGSFKLRVTNLNSVTSAVLSALMFDSH